MLASGEKYTSLWGKVSFRVVSNRQHSLFLVGVNPSVLSHLCCMQPYIDLISNTHTHTLTYTHRNSASKFKNVTRMYGMFRKIIIIYAKQHKEKKTPFGNNRHRFVTFEHRLRILTGYSRRKKWK